jgi:hypothetical protein
VKKTLIVFFSTGTLVPEKAVPLLIEKLGEKPITESTASTSQVKEEVKKEPSTPKEDVKTPAPSVPIFPSSF